MRSLYPKAKDHILEIQSFARKWAAAHRRVLMPLEIEGFLRNETATLPANGALNRALLSEAAQMILQLRLEKISTSMFQEALEAIFSHPGIRSPFLQSIATLYARYECAKKTYLDMADIYYSAVWPKSLSIEKILCMTHTLSSAEQYFFESLQKHHQTPIELFEEKALKNSPSIQLTEVNSSEEEVCWMVQDILRTKPKYSDVFIYAMSLCESRPLLEVYCERHGIAYRFCDSDEGPQNAITILQATPSQLEIGGGGGQTLYLCGLSVEPSDATDLREDEKRELNNIFGRSVFPTVIEQKEQLKRALHLRLSGGGELKGVYTHTLAPIFEEYFKENGFIQTENLSKLSLKTGPFYLESRRKSREVIVSQELLPSVYSVSALSQYEQCPFGFYLKECLSLKSREPISLELTAAQEGELLHDVLWRCFEFQKSLPEAFAEAYPYFTERFQKEILPVERERLADTVNTFLETEKTWTCDFTPKFHELKFGDPRPLRVRVKGKEILFRGKIDRVDVDEASKTFKIIDYKTGSHVPTEKEVMEAAQFQLTLYAIAVQDLWLKEYWPKAAYYYLIKDSEAKKGFEFATRDQWEVLKQKTLNKIHDRVCEIEQLKFQPTPSDCFQGCPWKFLCEEV